MTVELLAFLALLITAVMLKKITGNWLGLLILAGYLLVSLASVQILVPLQNSGVIPSGVAFLAFALQPLFVLLAFLLPPAGSVRFSTFRVIGYSGTLVCNLFPAYIAWTLSAIKAADVSDTLSGNIVRIALSAWVLPLFFSLWGNKQNSQLDKVMSVWMALFGILSAMGVLWVTSIASVTKDNLF